MYNLQGQVALVTGAGGEHGIGYAIARRLAEEGADVVVNDVSARPYPDAEWGGLDAAVAAIEALGRRSACVVADVGDPDQVDRMVAETLEKMGRIDILVNNAGTLAGWDRVPVVELEVDLFDAVQRTNVRGTYLVSRAVARHMLERGGGGRVVNISSIAGRSGTARYSAYNSSKFAVIGFTQALAQELAPAGITVNVICPGLVDTERVVPLAETAFPDLDPDTRLRQFREGYMARNPLGRIAEPGDVANTAAFLASGEAAYLTGIAVNVICPGLVDTERVVPLAETAFPDLDPDTRLRQFREGYMARNPLGRIAEPGDVANTAAFLASGEAAYLTGIAVNVCGGTRMD